MKTQEERTTAMENLRASLNSEFDMYAEGLTTDLETLRKICYEALETYAAMDICTTCGVPNTGNHCETYGGQLCPNCHEDKREYVVTTNSAAGTESQLAYSWQITPAIPVVNIFNQADILDMPIGATFSSSEDNVSYYIKRKK